MDKGVANVWVPVQDIDRALDFYENTLETHEGGTPSAWVTYPKRLTGN